MPLCRGAAAVWSDFKRALRYAEALDAGIIHVMSGLAEGAEARATLIGNLRWAAMQAPQQRLTGDALAVWRAYGARAGHVQIADVPGRVAPGFGGMVDFEALFAALGADGYDGFISAEYHPGEAGTNAGLGWMKAL